LFTPGWIFFIITGLPIYGQTPVECYTQFPPLLQALWQHIHLEQAVTFFLAAFPVYRLFHQVMLTFYFVFLVPDNKSWLQNKVIMR
jgi:hypothetical protein